MEVIRWEKSIVSNKGARNFRIFEYSFPRMVRFLQHNMEIPSQLISRSLLDDSIHTPPD